MTETRSAEAKFGWCDRCDENTQVVTATGSDTTLCATCADGTSPAQAFFNQVAEETGSDFSTFEGGGFLTRDAGGVITIHDPEFGDRTFQVTVVEVTR